MRLLTAALTVAFAVTFASGAALSETSPPSSQAERKSNSGDSGKPGTGVGAANPAPASVGGAISGQEDAAKGPSEPKGHTAMGLHPGR